jgi:uncharacterized protein YndB with AHSA1/START domain
MTDQHDTANAVITECELPDAPEKVWRALTVPELLAAWLMPNNIPTGQARPAPGDRFHFQPRARGAGKSTAGRVADGAIECEVLTVEANRLLRYRWRGREDERDGAGRSLDSIVTFELTRTTAGGTYLRVVHSDFPLSLRGPLAAPAEVTSNEAADSTQRTRSQALAKVIAFPCGATRGTRPRTRQEPVAGDWRMRWAA